MSAESEQNLIVLLQRQGKGCISMKWAIDLSDETQPETGVSCCTVSLGTSSETEANDLY